MSSSFIAAKIEFHRGYRIASLKLFGEIGLGNGLGCSHFFSLLQSIGAYDMVYAVLDSPGAALYDSWIIYDYFKAGPGSRFPSLVVITGECSGAAVLLALGFRQVLMRANTSMRFEQITIDGNAAPNHLTRTLAAVVAGHGRCTQDQVFGWMYRHRTLTPLECLKSGLCQGIV
jgi:hypothetical protein